MFQLQRVLFIASDFCDLPTILVRFYGRVIFCTKRCVATEGATMSTPAVVIMRALEPIDCRWKKRKSFIDRSAIEWTCTSVTSAGYTATPVGQCVFLRQDGELDRVANQGPCSRHERLETVRVGQQRVPGLEGEAVGESYCGYGPDMKAGRQVTRRWTAGLRKNKWSIIM